jgi:hypothetical protein
MVTSVVAPPGTGIVTVVTSPIPRPTWDALVSLIETFKSSHPEIQTVNFQWIEQSTG